MGTLFEIAKQGFAIKEIPIIFKDRVQVFKNSKKLKFLEL